MQIAGREIPLWLLILGGVVLVAALTTGGVVTANYVAAAWMSSQNAQKWAPTLAAAEDNYGIPTGLLSRIAYQESSFQQNVIDGTRASSAGALGMMQLMPQYFTTVQGPTPFTDQDTINQIDEAANLLSQLYTHYQNWTDAVAAYNAGQGTIDAVLAGKQPLPAQTAQYIAQVGADLPQYVNTTLMA